MKSKVGVTGIMKQGTRLMGVCLCSIVLMVACTGPKTEVAQDNINVDSLPSLYTRDVNTLISDSGITRYRIEAAAWYMYEGETHEDPYWYFPEGIYVEQFDSVFTTETMIEGDTAIYYKEQQLWRLDGNVHIENVEGRKFDTQRLYWNQKTRRIYSDVHIRITDDEEIIEGIGFDSNEQLTKYAIRRTTGIFTIERDTTTALNDSTTVEE
jgi:LPS export ABC transporter protein LptC